MDQKDIHRMSPAEDEPFPYDRYPHHVLPAVTDPDERGRPHMIFPQLMHRDLDPYGHAGDQQHMIYDKLDPLTLQPVQLLEDAVLREQHPQRQRGQESKQVGPAGISLTHTPGQDDDRTKQRRIPQLSRPLDKHRHQDDIDHRRAHIPPGGHQGGRAGQLRQAQEIQQHIDRPRYPAFFKIDPGRISRKDLRCRKDQHIDCPEAAQGLDRPRPDPPLCGSSICAPSLCRHVQTIARDEHEDRHTYLKIPAHIHHKLLGKGREINGIALKPLLTHKTVVEHHQPDGDAF